MSHDFCWKYAFIFCVPRGLHEHFRKQSANPSGDSVQKNVRGEGPVGFAQCTHGVGVAEVAGAVLAARAAVLVG